MTRHFLTVVILCFATSSSAETAKFLICPPELNYCYRETKPIKPQMDQADQERQINTVRYS